jgi:membrane protease YdiL (CAAX protease family)
VAKNLKKMKTILRNTLLFSVVGFIAGYVTATYQVEYVTGSELDQLIELYGSTSIFITLTAVQVLFYAAIASFVGQLLLKRVPYSLFSPWRTRAFITSIIIGLFCGAYIVLMDVYVFSNFLAVAEGEYHVNLLYLLSGILYGGIVEELLIRLLLLTLVVYLIQKVSKKDIKSITWIAIIITSIIFAIGHLPAAILLLGNEPIIIIRTVLLNVVPGILFGYAYTKYGLTYSMSAHIFTHLFMQLVFLPIYA